MNLGKGPHKTKQINYVGKNEGISKGILMF